MGILTDTSAMPYGKYKGRRMQDVSADYLLWLHENDKCSESVARYVEVNKPAIEQRQIVEADARKQRAAGRMPFGSYKGMEISQVPAEYLMAMYERGKCPPNVLTYIGQNMGVLQEQADKDRNNRALLRSMYGKND